LFAAFRTAFPHWLVAGVPEETAPVPPHTYGGPASRVSSKSGD
jgi:hypothetical protein